MCHTELDEIEGRTPPPHLPVIPGHQIIGRVEQCGRNVKRFSVGERAGIAWIHSSCGHCEYCRRNDENLCPEFVATGRDVHGGYAEVYQFTEANTALHQLKEGVIRGAKVLQIGENENA
jgi:propanol-preferring alcohol dehydrogenase